MPHVDIPRTTRGRFKNQETDQRYTPVFQELEGLDIKTREID